LTRATLGGTTVVASAHAALRVRAAVADHACLAATAARTCSGPASARGTGAASAADVAANAAARRRAAAGIGRAARARLTLRRHAGAVATGLPSRTACRGARPVVHGVTPGELRRECCKQRNQGPQANELVHVDGKGACSKCEQRAVRKSAMWHHISPHSSAGRRRLFYEFSRHARSFSRNLEPFPDSAPGSDTLQLSDCAPGRRRSVSVRNETKLRPAAGRRRFVGRSALPAGAWRAPRSSDHGRRELCARTRRRRKTRRHPTQEATDFSDVTHRRSATSARRLQRPLAPPAKA